MIRLLMTTLMIMSFNLFADHLVFKGEINNLESNLKAHFELEQAGESLVMKITPRGSLNECHFIVTEYNMPSPHRLNSLGYFYTEKVKCIYKFKPTEKIVLWNDIKLIDFSFQIDEEFKVKGDIVLHKLDQSYYTKFKID